MKTPKHMAIIKTGWSNDYVGDDPTGNYKFLVDRGQGHERFNFLPAPDGHYYGYLPPIGRDWAVPNPQEKSGWLLVFVAKRPKTAGLYIVGWYENAEFESEYLPRPEYAAGEPFEHDVHGETFFYAVHAESAIAVPEPLRTVKIDTKRIKRTPIAYLLGNGSDDRWRSDLARNVLQQMKALEVEIERQGWTSKDPRKPFLPPSAEHRLAVEGASMKEMTALLVKAGYDVDDISKEIPSRGYDLLATRKRAPKELHVEVKGTSGSTRQFLMSRNEHSRIDTPQWRLGMVTDALSKPRAELMDKAEVNRVFAWEVFTWLAREKN